jgi:hypothetical protein
MLFLPNPHGPRPRGSPIINIPNGGAVKFNSVGVVVVVSFVVVIAVTVAVSSLLATEI